MAPTRTGSPSGANDGGSGFVGSFSRYWHVWTTYPLTCESRYYVPMTVTNMPTMGACRDPMRPTTSGLRCCLRGTFWYVEHQDRRSHSRAPTTESTGRKNPAANDSPDSILRGALPQNVFPQRPAHLLPTRRSGKGTSE